MNAVHLGFDKYQRGYEGTNFGSGDGRADAEGFIDDGSAASLEGVTLVCNEGRGIVSDVGWADVVGFNAGWEDG